MKNQVSSPAGTIRLSCQNPCVARTACTTRGISTPHVNGRGYPSCILESNAETAGARRKWSFSWPLGDPNLGIKSISQWLGVRTLRSVVGGAGWLVVSLSNKHLMPSTWLAFLSLWDWNVGRDKCRRRTDRHAQGTRPLAASNGALPRGERPVASTRRRQLLSSSRSQRLKFIPQLTGLLLLPFYPSISCQVWGDS
jgi:hypothetical protein